MCEPSRKDKTRLSSAGSIADGRDSKCLLSRLVLLGTHVFPTTWDPLGQQSVVRVLLWYTTPPSVQHFELFPQKDRKSNTSQSDRQNGSGTGSTESEIDRLSVAQCLPGAKDRAAWR